MANDIDPKVPPSIMLRDGSEVELSRSPEGARVTVRSAQGGPQLDLEIALTQSGPVVRVRSAALELDVARQFVARCDTFRVEAASAIELHSGGTVSVEARTDLALTATVGGIKAQANDDLQLLGEQILLNTDRQAPLPRWLAAAPPAAVVPVASVSGDPELLDLVGERR